MKQSLLEQAGLNTNEAKVYEIVLEHGEIAPPEVAEISGLTRQNSYTVLKNLVQKELVEEIERRKKLHYRALQPSALIKFAEKNTKEAELAEKALISALPEFQSLYNLTNSKPSISYFEGVEGIKKIYEDTLRVGQPIYAFLSPQEVEPALYHWLTRNYVKRRVQKGISAQVIVSGNKKPEYTSKDMEELRETKIVSKSRYPIEIEIDIYGNKVAFINFKESSKLNGFIIDNPLVAEAMKSIFALSWEGV